MGAADDRDGTYPIQPDSPSFRSETLGWVVILSLAFVVFELTADSALAVVLGCLKFGTPDLRIARWSLRMDPERRRGRTVASFYVTLAIGRIGFVASPLLMVLIAANGLGMQQAQLERQAISAACVILACVAAGALTSWLAVGSALRSGVRVWMDATAMLAIRAGSWPHFLTDRSRPADLGPGVVVAYSVISAWLVSVIVLYVGTGSTSLLPMGLSLFTLVIILPFGVATIGSRVVALQLRDCYEVEVDNY